MLLALTILLVISSLLCFMASSWILLWGLLELNTLSFSAILSFRVKEDLAGRSAIKYFLIQSRASAVLVIRATMLNPNMTLILLLRVVFLTKIGAAPLHAWFLVVNRRVPWIKSFTLITWQKVAPLTLITYSNKYLVLASCILSMMTGTVSQYGTVFIKDIMAYSTISNLAWMLLTIFISIPITWLFLIFYAINMRVVFYTISITNIKEVKELKSKRIRIATMVMLRSLAGIPPLLGFLPKWQIATESVKQDLIVVAAILLTLTAITFYIYLRTIIANLRRTPSYEWNPSISQKILAMLTLINTPVLVVWMLYLLRLKKEHFDRV